MEFLAESLRGMNAQAFLCGFHDVVDDNSISIF